jgi:hypothetical protein
MSDFEIGTSPLNIDNLEMYQIWHSRNDDNPLHQWIRALLKKIALKI